MNESFGEVDQGGVGGVVVGPNNGVVTAAGGGGGKGHGEDDDNLVLWVGNLDSRTTESMVYELFIQAGPILNIRLPKTPDGGHKGYSFVTFQHEASVPYAINVMEGTTLFGKKLKLQPRPGSVHRKIMDQKKISEQRQEQHGFQGQPQGTPLPQQALPQQPQPQWFAHPQMAQVPNMFYYQNQLYQSFTPNPNLNMNVMAIPLQQMAAAPYVQIPVQQQATMPPPHQPVIRQRLQNGYNNYVQGVPQHHQTQTQIRTPSPHQQQQPSHFNGPQVNGQSQQYQQQQHQPRGHYQGTRGTRPQRNGGFVNNGTTANNNSRMPYHQQQQQQQRMPSPMQHQPFMLNAYQGQTVQLLQAPEYRQGTHPPNFSPGRGGTPNFPNPAAPNGYHAYHY